MSFGDELVSTAIKRTTEELTLFLGTPENRVRSWKSLRLDLRATPIIDSRGLNLLAGLIRRARLRAATTTIEVESLNVYRLLQFIRIERHATLVLVQPAPRFGTFPPRHRAA